MVPYMDDARLRFQDFQAQIDEAFPEEPEAIPGTAERYSMYVMFLGALVAFLATLLGLGTAGSKALAAGGLVVELTAGAIHIVLALVRNFRGLSLSEKKGADELEKDFNGYVKITTWLRQFSEEELQSRLLFSSNRATTWQNGTMLIWGGMEKLGMLPVVAALYLQFKDTKWVWPPDVTVLGLLLGFLLFFFYALGFWALTRRMQATRFERFLKIALKKNFRVGKADATEGVAVNVDPAT